MMAEQSSVCLPVAAETTMSSGVESRRQSIGNVIPHYLRASTGSCHDFCKYGRKLALEAIEKRSTPISKDSCPEPFSALTSHVMAEQSVDSPMVSETTKSSGVELRRHSTGKAISRNNKGKVIPHYLMPFTGSCHDLCKYGKKHEHEGIEKCSVFKEAVVDSKPTRISAVERRKSIDSKLHISCTSNTNKPDLLTKSSDIKKQIGNEVLSYRNKTSLVKVKSSTFSKPLVSTTFKVETRSKSGSKKKQTSSKSTSNKKETLQKSTSNEKETPSKSASEKKETPAKSTFDKKESPSKSISNKKETLQKSTSNKKETPSKSTSEKKETTAKSTFDKKESPSKSTFRRPVKTNSTSTPKKMETSSKLSSLKGKEMEFSDEKHVISLNPNSNAMQSISSMDSWKDIRNKRNSEIKKEKREAKCKVDSPLKSKPSHRRNASFNARMHKSLKIVSQVKIQHKHEIVEPKEHNEEDEAKTLHVIKVESEGQTSQFDQNVCQDIKLPLSSSSNFSPSSSNIQSKSKEDKDESEYVSNELFEEDSSSGNCEIDECIENGEISEIDEDVTCVEEKDSKKLKLKLAKGKFVDTQTEKISPRRRLKFRVLGDNATKVKDGAYANGTEIVFLRHLDVQRKKDGRRLFNTVIEETASKLVKSQKSKVKALVGAFETVISLQEKNPFANIVS